MYCHTHFAMISQYSLLLGASPGRCPKSSWATRSQGAGRLTDSSTRPFRWDDTCKATDSREECMWCACGLACGVAYRQEGSLGVWLPWFID